MAGFVAGGSDARKIKGGRWTVVRFFLVSVAFTSAWLAVSSQLDYYRRLHGPQVLLQLNIAYYLPSIPLLVLSALLDKPLEARLGVARTILVRLLLGLLGYGAVTAWLPFSPPSVWCLLGAVVALGLFSGIAFSASYQLVARFANKNVIALGLGCSASGPLVLALQLAFGVGHEPSRRQQVLLYESIAVVIVAGLWATTSLLLRHWAAIEDHASKPDLAEPLLQRQGSGGAAPGGPDAAAAAAAADAAEDGVEAGSPASPRESPSPRAADSGGALSLGQVWRQRSLPPLAAYTSLEPFQTFLSTDQEAMNSYSLSGPDDALLAAVVEDGEEASSRAERGSPGASCGSLTRQLSAPGGSLVVERADGSPLTFKGPAGSSAGPAPPTLSSPLPLSMAGATAAESPQPAAGEAVHRGAGGASALHALRLIWAPLAALSLSSCIALVVFPFFTYVPTSGLLGENLPKVLFFMRIFSDVLGRFLPRLACLAPRSPLTPLVAATIKLMGVPIFLCYLKSPPWLHSDVAIVIFICFLWVLGGYINTMANLLAPRLVPAQLKGTAAALMALCYQSAHIVGLSLATLLVYLLYGTIDVEG